MAPPADESPHHRLELPSTAEFAKLGVAVGRELHGGHQSLVVVASPLGEPTGGPSARELVIKLIHTDGLDEAEALARLQVRNRVAGYDDRVVPIIPLAGHKVNRIGAYLAVASPKIDGRFLDVANGPDVERMGRALARLHQSLRLVHVELPPVLPLRSGAAVEVLQDNHQLLHGDFNPTNLLLDSAGLLWIYDFDDCGYGPVEFELGNTLFSALFATSQSLNQPSEEYRSFRHRFLAAYRASAEHAVSDLVVDIALQARSDALRYWLNHLDEAPPGIRNSSAAWQQRLRAFAGIMHR